MPINSGKITLHYTLIFELKKIVEINKLDNLIEERSKCLRTADDFTIDEGITLRL